MECNVRLKCKLEGRWVQGNNNLATKKWKKIKSEILFKKKKKKKKKNKNIKKNKKKKKKKK